MRNKHITAEIIADSLSPQGDRLTSYIVTVPRIVLAEFNTHRMISRNSASSRAIPFNKMLEKVLENPFIPIKWQKDHSGMQGSEYLSGRDRDLADGTWLRARDRAVEEAKMLNHNINVSKQFCNRLLEPFMYHTIIATASEWSNFFALRAHGAAEIHIQDLAFKMLEAYNESKPKQLKAGEWHIPFGDKIDEERVYDILDESNGDPDRYVEIDPQDIEDTKVKIATARCARVSYLNYEGTDDYEKDIKLHDRLEFLNHTSPFEHCARAMSDEEYNTYVKVEVKNGKLTMEKGWCKNFRGFLQYRANLTKENLLDERIKSQV